MEIETKIDNSAIKQKLSDLDSDNPRKIKTAVNNLARMDKNKQLREALREIVSNFKLCDNCAAIWAIVILGIMRDQEAVPYLLDVFESDEDFTEEASMEALIQIENAYPDSVVPEVFEFIEKRIENDPNRAKIFASGVLEPFIHRLPVKNFLIKLFEKDKKSQDYIGSILVDSKDEKILELFKRALIFAEQSGATDYEISEMKWHYYYLANGISYDEKYPENKLWKKNWEQRWGHLLEKLGKEDEESEEEFDKGKIKKELEQIDQDLKSKEADREFKKELAARDAQIIEPFCLAKWLGIRQRSKIESEFQWTLDLIGAGDIWQVEDIQKIMNENQSFGPVAQMIAEKINFSNEKSLAAVIESLNHLWNNTPREELGGLTPSEMLQIYQEREEYPNQ